MAYSGDEGDFMSEYCPKCGQYTGGDSFCPNCGAKIFDESGLEEINEEEESGGGGGEIDIPDDEDY